MAKIVRSNEALNTEVDLNTAKVSNVSTNLSYTTAATTGTVVSSDGTDATIPAATTTLAGLLTGTDKTKLNGIESNATADQTAAEILTAIKTIDGSGSGLDADLLDGLDSTAFLLKATTLLTNADNLDNYSTVGDSFQWNSPDPINAPFSYAYMTIVDAGTQPMQIVYGYAYSQKFAMRRKDLGTWDTEWTEFYSNYNANLSTVDWAVNNLTVAGTVDGRDVALDGSKLDGIEAGADVNVATNLTATAGTTAGPTINSSTGTNVVIPSASATASGIVTTGTQTFTGIKTFNDDVIINKTGAGGSLIVGTATAAAVDSIISIEGARTSSNTSEIAALNFKNDTDSSYDMARIIAQDPSGLATLGNGSLVIKTSKTGVLQTAITVDENQDVNFAQDVNVSGNLTISGTTTTLDTATLLVTDKNIELGTVTTPTDVTANGGGITLKGTTDKTIIWTDATNTWDFNQGINSIGTIVGTSVNGITGLATINPLMDGTVSLGTSTLVAKQDHRHASDTSRSPLAGSTSITTLGTITTGTWSGTTIAVLKGGTGVTTSTGSGNNVLSTSPTLVTPVLGTPTSGNLSNCTFPTLNQSTTGNAATATWADTVDVNGANTSATFYDVVWHSGDSVYSSAGVEIQGSTNTLRASILDAKESLNLGATQEASIQYNSTDNSIDFIIN
jgi:hypothetical protein